MTRASDADDHFFRVFESGRKAARTGAPLISNPYLDREQSEHAAWADGFNSVDLVELTAI